MNAQRRTPLGQVPRRGFTLTELLVVIMVIGILSSTMLFAMYGAAQQAKEARAQTQVVKLHDLLMTRWDSYRTRPVRLLTSAGTSLPIQARRDAKAMALARVTALRDLMRLEMPDRIFDVRDPNDPTDPPVDFVLDYSYPNAYGNWISDNVTIQIPRPSLNRQYDRQGQLAHDPLNPTNKGFQYWTSKYEGAECLYLIIASIRDFTGNGLDVLQDGEIGDLDNDGMREILDPWGNPIAFLRWAPGYLVSPGSDGNWGVADFDDDNNGVKDDFWEAWDQTSVPWVPGGYGDDRSMITPMALAEAVITPERVLADPPDPFNPLRADPKQVNSSHPDTPRNFALYPLIFSAGPDGKYDINVMGNLNYAGLSPPNDPYYVPPIPPTPPAAFPAGTPMDNDQDGELNFIDNITNHAIDTR
jgi:prepilin-type N-terminal cleavage/methylation domain-containing protein